MASARCGRSSTLVMADDLETLNAVSKLYFEGLLYNTRPARRRGRSRASDERESLPELSEMVLPHISSGPPVTTHTLAPAWPSVPSGDGAEWTRWMTTRSSSIFRAPRACRESCRFRRAKRRGGARVASASGGDLIRLPLMRLASAHHVGLMTRMQRRSMRAWPRSRRARSRRRQ